MRRVAAVLLLLTACTAPSEPATTASPTTTGKGPSFAYSLVAPLKTASSGLVARAVLPAGASCPDLQTGGAGNVPTTRRIPAQSTRGAFDDVVVCSAPIPAGARTASIAGIPIPAAMPTSVQTVAALGDTGCLIREVVQDCQRGWPFHEMAQRIAEARPDLIIHLGDYFYRERACPPDAADKCGGSPAPPKGVPFLDSGAAWLADFFEPARPLFGSAPLLATRGNHEICSVAGNGYFLFLDVEEGTEGTCAPTAAGKAPVVQTKPWRVDVRLATGGDLRLVVVDAANGWDYGVSPWSRKQRPLYVAANRMGRDPAGMSWLVVHQPPVGLTTTKYNPGNVPDWTNWVAVDQTVASRGLLSRYAAILSGHLHLSQVLKVPGVPPQFIVGGGGTFLDPPTGYSEPQYGPLADSRGQPLVPGVKPYPLASYRWLDVTHAFTIAKPDPAGGDWQVQYVGPDGSPVASCTVRRGTPQCS